LLNPCFTDFSLEKVSQDVDGHTEQIGKLEVGVAGTKVVLKRVQKDVKQQGKEIEGVKEEVSEVNKRVDQVEVDVEETKERVEEVDKKVWRNTFTF
jgi:septal ring factor EnvC (AmiA/AmiB activator)